MLLQKEIIARKNRITAYTEDKENILFVKAILKSKAFVLDFVDVTLPCSTLMELVTKRVPAFIYPYSIVILDGDVRMNKMISGKSTMQITF